jgi:hypothetical protein
MAKLDQVARARGPERKQKIPYNPSGSPAGLEFSAWGGRPRRNPPKLTFAAWRAQGAAG